MRYKVMSEGKRESEAKAGYGTLDAGHVLHFDSSKISAEQSSLALIMAQFFDNELLMQSKIERINLAREVEGYGINSTMAISNGEEINVCSALTGGRPMFAAILGKDGDFKVYCLSSELHLISNPKEMQRITAAFDTLEKSGQQLTGETVNKKIKHYYTISESRSHGDAEHEEYGKSSYPLINNTHISLNPGEKLFIIGGEPCAYNSDSANSIDLQGKDLEKSLNSISKQYINGFAKIQPQHIARELIKSNVGKECVVSEITNGITIVSTLNGHASYADKNNETAAYFLHNGNNTIKCSLFAALSEQQSSNEMFSKLCSLHKIDETLDLNNKFKEFLKKSDYLTIDHPEYKNMSPSKKPKAPIIDHRIPKLEEIHDNKNIPTQAQQLPVNKIDNPKYGTYSAKGNQKFLKNFSVAEECSTNSEHKNMEQRLWLANAELNEYIVKQGGCEKIGSGLSVLHAAQHDGAVSIANSQVGNSSTFLAFVNKETNKTTVSRVNSRTHDAQNTDTELDIHITEEERTKYMQDIDT